MSKKTVGLILGLVILTVVLLAVALRPVFFKPSGDSPQEVSLTVTPTPPAYTLLSLSPNPVTTTAAGGNVEVVIDTKENSVTGVQLELSYDPAVLTNVTLTPGEFFPNATTLLDSVDTATGRVTYALVITPAQTPVKGQGVVARINFNVLPGATGETQIELMPKTEVTQQGIGPSVLKEASGTTVVIGTSAPAPSVQVSTPVQATLAPVQ